MPLASIRRFFAAAPHIERLPEEEARRRYPRFRWQIMEATFLGYAMFYLVRNNLSVVAKDMKEALGYDNSAIGSIVAVTAITYGLGKFLMGAVSDRSNPRVFMAFGLLITAICNFAFGAAESFPVHLALWAINGFFQGMGWPPCGRLMGHWFGEKERGLTFSIWNTSHNFGGAAAGYVAGWAAVEFGGWSYAFYFPGVLAAAGSLYLFWRLRDTPQSVGLPPIEEYQADLTPHAPPPGHVERELTWKELLIDHTLANPYVWVLAVANFFAYVTRYSMLDWGPMYLREVKHATIIGGGLSVTVLELSGVPSTILLGLASDRLGGRRGMVATLSMVPILAAFTALLFIPPGYLTLDLVMLGVVGLFIYPVINLIVIQALDLTSKKAIGTAAGFIGLFGYIGRTVQAKGFGWMLDYFKKLYDLETAWSVVIATILGCTLLGVLLLAFTWRLRPRA